MDVEIVERSIIDFRKEWSLIMKQQFTFRSIRLMQIQRKVLRSERTLG